ncbi:MAG: flagellin [Rhodocyclales bacterium]|nr:flagellin [Rhodocyclales bacterium]
MASVINTNISSLTAQRNLLKSQNDMQTAMQRLSSGLRINSAKDDAAGLAISDRMSAQINGLNQATRNANDAMSIAQVAEGALGEVTNALQRIRVLAVQSANDTNTATDRASLQKEVNQLQQEITRLATQTSFNGKNLLDGTFTGQFFHVGAYADQTIGFSIGDSRAASIGTYQISTNGSGAGGIEAAVAAASAYPTANNMVAQDIAINGPRDSVTLSSATTITAGVTAKQIADAVNSQSEQTGVTATARTTVTMSSLASAGTVSFTLHGANNASATVTAQITDKNDLSALANAINQTTGTTGVSASFDKETGELTLVQAEGYDIGIEGFTNSAGGSISVKGSEGNAVSLSGTTNSTRVGGEVTFNSSGPFSVTAGSLFNTTGANYGELKSVTEIDISTQPGANDALKIVDGALAYVDDLRADLGAIQNRFSSVVSSNQVTSETVAAARSRVLDADFAAETANLSRAQILQQAGTAMLAQANASTQNVLTLLR